VSEAKQNEKQVEAFAARLAQAARLEIGARVLVLGASSEGDSARALLRECRRWGTLRRVVQSEDATFENEAETVYSTSQAPGAPFDVVFVVGNAAQNLPAALPLCRNGGTVVWCGAANETTNMDFYPDAHKRGLRVVGLSHEIVDE
jgi:D-arabinose 1-dehydrogenase-like Zn-dependent alcohol dehydrogenase